MNVWVVIPTYNERDNIERLIREIFSLSIENLKVLIVDDASPDGTGQVVESLRHNFSRLQVLHRSGKFGLARAYVAGFEFALARGAEYLVQMDADFSHDPAVIPQLLAVVRNGADLALGSRYCAGGRIVNWNWPRRFVSSAGNWYARSVLAVHVADLTGGFKCFRRQALERIRPVLVRSTGYNFQIEMTYKALQCHLLVKEIPITFTERRLGRSKFSLGIIVESMLGVWRLRRRRGAAQ